TSDSEDAPDWTPRPAPTPTQIAVAEAGKTTRRVLDRVRSLGDDLRDGRALAERAKWRAAGALSALRSGWLTTAEHAPRNHDHGPNRRFDWVDIGLADVKAIKDGLGGSVNDAVLSITAGALRRFLIEERDYDPSGHPFRVMNPVSTRSANERGKLGNQVAMWLL